MACFAHNPINLITLATTYTQLTVAQRQHVMLDMGYDDVSSALLLCWPKSFNADCSWLESKQAHVYWMILAHFAVQMVKPTMPFGGGKACWFGSK